jgi:hypothetical protein
VNHAPQHAGPGGQLDSLRVVKADPERRQHPGAAVDGPAAAQGDEDAHRSTVERTQHELSHPKRGCAHGVALFCRDEPEAHHLGTLDDSEPV